MIWKECKDIQNKLIEMRRDLHKIPELGLNLPKTQEYVTKKLDELGISYKKSPTDSSVVATIKGGHPGKTVALRADMDALPIKEETGKPFASTHDGCMHACGHDAHTAILLTAAEVLQKHASELKGTVKLLFQTAEELSKGAVVLIKDGALEGVDAVFGLHVGSIIDKGLKSGTLIICPGPVMASFDRFIIKVKGTGCHGSTPEKGVDPINIAAHIVLGLEALQAREFAACVPCVTTIGKIAGGHQYNIIPGEVVIEGTTRALSEDVRKRLAKRIEEISKGCAEAFGGSIDFEMDWGATSVVNDKAMAELAASAAEEVVGPSMLITHRDAPNMGGEDFAELLQVVPGAYYFLSTSDHAKGTDIAHHNCKFDVDEDVLWVGAASFVSIVEKFLGA